jgi:hypothetical protein
MAMSMPIDSGCLGFQGCVFGASLEERTENGIRVMEIIVHDVNEERGLHELVDEFLGGRTGLVELGPLTS